MSRLIIWDEETKILSMEFVKDGTKEYCLDKKNIDKFLDSVQGNNNKKKQESISLTLADYTFIIFDQETLNKFFSVKKISIDELIILPELSWNTVHLQSFHGYNMLKYLMEKDWLNPPLKIIFASTLTRKTLYSVNANPNKVFTKRFPHFKISLKNENYDSCINKVLPICERKYNYYKTYCLQKSGIVDMLAHSVKNSIAGVSNKENVKTLLFELKQYLFLYPQTIITLIDQFNTHLLSEIYSSENIKDILLKIENDLLELARELSEEQPEQKKNSDYVVMLVEDNEDTKNKLKNILKKYYTNIEEYSNGEEASKKIIASGDDYDILITDLELEDNDHFSQNIEGIDLIDLCDEKAPHIVKRVITGIPKNAISNLLKGINAEHVVHKDSKNTISPFIDFNQFIHEINKKVEWEKRVRSYPGPQNGTIPVRFKKYYYELKENDADRFNEIWRSASQKAKDFIMNELENDEIKKIETEFWSPKSSPTKIPYEKKIELFLTHRLIVLLMAKQNSNNFLYSNDDDDSEGLSGNKNFKNNLPISTTKYFNTTLGFSYKKNKINNRTYISINDLNDTFTTNLFPLEQETFNSFDMDAFIKLKDKFGDYYIKLSDAIVKIKKKYTNNAIADKELQRKINEFNESFSIQDFATLLSLLVSYKNSTCSITEQIITAINSAGSDNEIPSNINALLTQIEN